MTPKMWQELREELATYPGALEKMDVIEAKHIVERVADILENFRLGGFMGPTKAMFIQFAKALRTGDLSEIEKYRMKEEERSAGPVYHTFTEAFEAFEQGRAIKRAEWKLWWEGDLCVLALQDLRATDWQIREK